MANVGDTRRSILITGAASGFGALTARLALARGWRVVATSRVPEARILSDERSEGLLRLELDVTDEASVRTAVDRALQTVGSLDAVVNNAGIGLVGAAEELTVEDIRGQMETNFLGAVRVTLAALPSMRKCRRGRLIFISSDLGRTGAPALSTYCAAKHALEGWAESLSHEVAPFGIGVTLIEPGAFNTGFHDRSLARVPSASANQGPYAPLYRSLDERFFSGPEPPTGEAVAEAVLRAAAGEEPRLRVPVGEDAREWAARRFSTDEEAFIQELARRYGWDTWGLESREPGAGGK